jgi:hypothetical protein
MLRLLALSFVFILGTQLSVWFPGSTYDPAVPTPKSVLGYEIGEYYTEHPQMTGYMRRLEAASPRVKVFRVGETNERRELILVAISDPENIQRLESVRTTIEELRDPRRTTEARARAIAASTPAIAWMNFANDGNESAALETAIQLAYQLAAAQDDVSMKILKEVVTVIYPAHNPESHSRHVAWMKASATGNPDPAAQEHQGDWRMDANNNHYQIDLNRDAAFQSQIESQVVVREIHRWNPVVFVDHHGNPDRFFFPPWAIPVNRQLDDTARRWVNTYGRDIAKAFDRNGWTYFTRNVFDLHYPGYYDTYPTLNGATGMTFETDGGGEKGLAYELPDGRVTTLRDGILHHFTGAMATLVTTSECRAERIVDLYNFRAAALKEAAADTLKQYVLLPGRDPSNAADLVDLLLKHKIEVHRAKAGFSSATAHALPDDLPSKKSFPAGAFIVYANQPQKRLLRTLLDRETPLQPEFVETVRKAKAYNDGTGQAAPRKSYGFYDINAWSLPLAYGVDACWTEERFDGEVEAVESRPAASWTRPARAAFAYIFPWNSRGATRMVSELWKKGCKVSLAREAFTLAGRDFPAGTVVVRVQPNPDSIHTLIPALAAETEVEVVAAGTALVDKGKDLGDASVVDLKAPSIAVVCEPPTSPTAYGAIWFMLEKMYGIPFTAIKGEDLAEANLRRYDIIVLPDGRPAGYARLFERELDRLRYWVREGGTLVCIKGAAAWAAGEKNALTTARDRYAEPDAADKAAKQEKPPRRIDTVPGVFVQLRIDAEHYLGTGIQSPLAALFRSNVVFTPSEKGARAARIDAERPVLAGFAFDDGRDALKGADFLWDEPTGRGHVICFADDVTFRTFLHAAHRLFLNAILLPSSEAF